MDTTSSSSRLALLLAVVAAVMGAARAQEKSGACPPATGIGICAYTCYSDEECLGSQKCCETACGGTACLQPVTSRKLGREEKMGACPARPSGPWVCSSRCSVDSDCRGTQKCCRNRCGALACQKPELGGPTVIRV